MVGWVASLVAIADSTTTELQNTLMIDSSDFSCQTVLFCVQFSCVVLIHALRCNDDD